MNLRQSSLFMEGPEYSEAQTSEVDHHGPGVPWGPPLADRTTRWWSSTPPLGQFGKGKEEFLLELGLPSRFGKRGRNSSRDLIPP
jgi:hypothetical protein